MRNPFKRDVEEKALTASAGVLDAIENQGWTAMPLLGTGARERILAIFNRAQGANYGWLYAKSPALRTVIDEITKAVGELELRLYEEVSEAERQPKPNHPAALSLRYPNEYTPADSWVRSLVKDWLIHDNAYSLLTPGTNGRIQLTRIPAYMVEVQGSSLFAVDNYRIWPQGAWTNVGSWGGSGTAVDIPPEAMLHWHGENPADPRMGLSHLDTLRGVIAEDAALQQASVELANAGLQEPTWVFRPVEAPKWSMAAEKGFTEDLANRMRSRNKRPVVLEEGMELRSFGVTPHDAEMMALRRWAVAQVASEYDVPNGKVGLEPVTQEVEDAFVTDCLKPVCKDFAKALNLRVLVRVYDWTEGSFEFNLDERLMGNDRLRALVSATGRAVMVTNEARAKINLPPVEGGDELVTPLNVIVGEKPSPMVMGPQDPNAVPQDGSYRTDQPAPPSPVPPKALVKVVAGEPIAQLLPRRAADMQRQRRNIDIFQGVVQTHLNRVGRSLAKKAAVDESWARWDREFSDDLDTELQRVVQAEGDVYMVKLAAAEGFDMSRVKHYLRAMAEGAATAINETIRSEVAQLGVDDAMARAPAHVVSAGTSLGARSTMWAREEAGRQSGSYEQRLKTWIADTDRHAEFDGDTVPVGEDWPAGFAPGSAPGCACSESIG